MSVESVLDQIWFETEIGLNVNKMGYMLDCARQASNIMDISPRVHDWIFTQSLQTHLYVFESKRVVILCLDVRVFVHVSVCAAVHAKRAAHCLECCFCPV